MADEVTDIEIFRPDLKPRESHEAYKERARKENSEKLEALVEAFAHGEGATMGQIRKLAKKIGITEYQAVFARNDSRVAKVVRQRIQVLATHLTAQALPYQAELAKTSAAAFTTLAKVAEVLSQNGVSVQTNITIDSRKGADPEAIMAFNRRFEARQDEKLGRNNGSD